MSDNVSQLHGKTEKRPLRRIILFAVLVLLVCAGIAAYVFRDALNTDAVRRFVRYLNVSGSETNGQFLFDAGNTNRYADFDGGLAVASLSGVAAYAADGSEFTLTQEKMSAPALCQAGRYVLAYDVGGTALHEISAAKGSVLDLSAERPILDADLAEDGSLCYSSSESGYKSVLYVYNARQALIYRRLSASQYLPICAVSKGAAYAAAAALGQHDGVYETTIQILKTDEEDVTSSVSFGSELIYDLTFADADTVLAVGEDHARWYTLGGEKLGSYDYTESYLKDFDFGGSGFLTLVLNKYQAGNRYHVTTVGSDGEALGSLEFDEQILDVSAAGKYVAVLTAGKLNIYDSTMHLYAQTDNTSGAANAVMRADGTALLIGSGRASRYVP